MRALVILIVLALAGCDAEPGSSAGNAGEVGDAAPASGGGAGGSGSESVSGSGGGRGSVAGSTGGAGDAGGASDGGVSRPEDASTVPATDATAPDAGPVEFVPPTCRSKITALPGDAPALTPGVWKNVSPSGDGLSFGSDANLTQGMTIDPCNSATLYLAVCAVGGSGSYPKGVYRTTNAGTSWVRVLQADSPNHVRVNPGNPLDIYATDGVAGGTNGFYRTSDGGKTWDRKMNLCSSAGVSGGCGLNDLYDVATDPSNFEHILVSFHSPWDWNEFEAGAGILESRDGGDTWIPHKPADNWGQGHSVHFLYRPDLGIGSSSTWLVGTQSGGHYRTADGGETWNQVSTTPITHGGSSIYYSNDKTLYAASNSGLLKSTDNGANFERLASNTNFYPIGIIGDGETMYAGGDTLLTAPESAPTTWTVPPGAPAPVSGGGPFEYAFDKENRIVYAASNIQGLWALKLR